MALNVWTQDSILNKIILDTLYEGETINLKLPVSNDDGVTYSVITGSLPPGLLLQGNYIKGAPTEVFDDTVFSFCIRASLNNRISDRTFEVTVTGPDVPIILTTAGLLDIGPAKQLFVVDNSIVNYQLNAVDYDLSAGQTLKFFISSGELPPGLKLTSDGRIVGVIQSITAITPASGSGSYDNGYYDVGPFDFAIPPKQNGYDTIKYDYAVYDYLAVRHVKSINRKFDFIVSVTDGILTPSRAFQIYVVNKDYFRADTDDLISDVGLFTADISYLQAPVWITPSDLGTFRANNYVTLVFDVYSIDIVYFSIDDVSKLPPGLSFDQNTGDIYGYVPYQPAVTTFYSFTITATTHGDEDKNEKNSSSRTFNLKLIGEIDSVITWQTESNLGHLKTSHPSMFSLKATSTVQDAVVIHRLIDGKLPPGLDLKFDGEIVGVVPYLSNKLIFDMNRTYFDGIITSITNIPSFDNGDTTFDKSPTTTFDKKYTRQGLTTIDYVENTRFDNNKTTIDRQFKFTVEAHDQYYYSATRKEFSITIDTPTHATYDNIVVKPFMDLTDRINWDNFITNLSIFPTELIYRPYDSNFGVQTELAMLVYAGLQESDITQYVEQMQTNYKNKRFKFGEVKKGIALTPGTHNEVYEVIYINMIDPIDSLVNHLSQNTIINKKTYYISSVTTWQHNLNLVSTTNNELLPLWMRTIQPNNRVEIGYTLAVPLCYCKAGAADQILLNIKHSNFKFNLLDYTIDRLIIRSSNNYADKYIIFNNNRNNI